jgi:glyoxylase-like metal-dependent hydrolase (beta-lactamase superfamily II)
MSPLNIVNVGYDSANYYVLAGDRPLLLIDTGFPRTMGKLDRACQRMDIACADIPYLLCTHYHPDHAGLAQELKQTGMRLLVLELQVPFVPLLRDIMKPLDRYVDITLDDNIVVKIADSRDFLAGLGLQGQIVHTPGHSDDSVSLVLDTGEAFTGDLGHPLMLMEPGTTTGASWQTLHDLGATTVYPGHGPAWQLGQVGKVMRDE